MDRDYGVQEIDLIDLLFYILRRWRVLLIGMVVMAVLFSTVMYVRHNAQHTEETKEEVSEEAQFLVDAIKARETYVEESLLMKVNPYAENVVVLYYYVDTDYKIDLSETIEENPAKDIVRDYQDYLQGGSARQQIADALNMDVSPYYVGELVKTNIETDNRFSVTVIGTTAEQAEQMADEIETLMTERRMKIQDILGTHDLTLLNRYSVCVVSWDVYNAQKEVYDAIEALRVNLDALGVDAQQIAEEQETSRESGSVSFFQLKYIIVGGIGGIFIVVCVIAAMYVLSGKLHSDEEMNRMYHIPILGTISDKGNRRNPIDRLLDRLSGRTLSSEVEMTLAIETLRLVCKERGLQKVYITGSKDWKQRNEGLLHTVIMRMKENGIELVYGKSVLLVAQSLKNMNEIGTVILMEKINVSKCRDIVEEKKKISLCGCEILGSIILNEDKY